MGILQLKFNIQILFIRSCQPLLNCCIMKFLLVALCSLAMASAIDVEICDPEITEAHFDNLDIAVDPDPIIVEAGKQVGLHFAIDLLNQINGGTVKIDIMSGSIPVPCLEVTRYFHRGYSFEGYRDWKTYQY